MLCKIKNWREFQHYRDRNPPWIKLHFSILSSSDWVMLDDASRVLAVACMLVGSRNGGQIDTSSKGAEYMQRIAYLKKKPDFKPLIECGFIEYASGCKQMLADARPETETETETETDSMSGKPDVRPPVFTINGKKQEAVEVLQFLNAKTGRHYQPVDANLRLIAARLKEGASVQDCRSVIAKKAREWGSDGKMEPYLRPATLFNATKFAQYRGELIEQPEEPKND